MPTNFCRSSSLLLSELDVTVNDGIIGSLELYEAFGRALIELLSSLMLVEDALVNAIVGLL